MVRVFSKLGEDNYFILRVICRWFLVNFMLKGEIFKVWGLEWKVNVYYYNLYLLLY